MLAYLMYFVAMLQSSTDDQSNRVQTVTTDQGVATPYSTYVTILDNSTSDSDSEFQEAIAASLR